MNALRQATRQLFRYASFRVVVIATLALGIGERIVRVLQVSENGGVSDNISEPNFRT
ncbi:MAG TPA: hypothetical protein VF339_12620 [Gammaproteobacteria bacterium]